MDNRSGLYTSFFFAWRSSEGDMYTSCRHWFYSGEGYEIIATK